MQLDASIELPGFRIEREFAAKAGRRVCLAYQVARGRRAVLKISPLDARRGQVGRHLEALAAEAGGVSGLAQGLAISDLAKLQHPDIVRVHETLRHDDLQVLVLEYINGGNLSQRLQSGVRMRDLVGVLDVIGSALDYAHDQGFLHLDIRPENILFRADNKPVLSDFSGGWRTDRGPPPGAFTAQAGVPGYMSPEQSAGRALDFRSDIYGLGAVLYHVMIGRVPHQAGTIAFGDAGRFTERPARLPTHLSTLQAVVDQGLAADPKRRFQRGTDLARALQAASRDTSLTDTTFKSVAVSVDEIRTATAGLFTAPVDAPRQEHRRHRKRKSLRSGLTGVSLLLLTVLGVGYLFRAPPAWLSETLSEMGLAEDMRLRTAWLDAQSLHDDPNQSLSTIVAGYRRVLAIDAGHVGAETSVAGLAEQWQSSIDGSLKQNDIVQTETKLNEMSAAFPDHPALADLRGQLEDRRAAQALLASTQTMLRSQGLSDVPSATAAIQSYQEILRLAPEHPVALAELDALGKHYAGLAQQAVERGDVPVAISFLERATAANSDLPLLSGIRAEIQQATTARAALEELLQQARTYRVENRLVTPPGENAAELYNRVLATAPDNALARQGLSEVTSQLLTQASRMLEADDFTGLEALADQANAAGVEPDELLEIRNRMDQRIADLAMVAKNLQEAESLLRQGFITEPPEQNAIALLREAERLDPGNARAESLLAQAATRLVEVAVEAHTVGLTDQANQYLELALTVTPDEPAWRTLRESWE